MEKDNKKKEKKEKPKMTELEAQEKLARVMNNTPVSFESKIGKLKLTALKPAVQWLIAEKSVDIQKSEDGNMADMIRHFAKCVPAVVEIITLAVLNDKDKIFENYEERKYSDEYRAMYDKIMWETDQSEWLGILLQIFELLSYDFFFNTTNLLTILREKTLKKKMTSQEMRKKLQSMSLQELNGDK